MLTKTTTLQRKIICELQEKLGILGNPESSDAEILSALYDAGEGFVNYLPSDRKSHGAILLANAFREKPHTTRFLSPSAAVHGFRSAILLLFRKINESAPYSFVVESFLNAKKGRLNFDFELDEVIGEGYLKRDADFPQFIINLRSIHLQLATESNEKIIPKEFSPIFLAKPNLAEN